ncbi:hypothetical protein HOLleu_24720 [Holothuria leucospilota]|uniref:HTH CENPB-type domain-containing protein n=1 Tax=Holothuria leucospilota TaxID=206669 RepID=A0A9Q1BRM9_HOLLE|nr:hypothetical protein HOLleu_24720 [Holothuria leucospilota]
MAKVRRQKRSGKNTLKEKKPVSPIKLKKVSKRKGPKLHRKKKTTKKAMKMNSFSSEVEERDHVRASLKRRRKSEKHREKERRNRKNKQSLAYRKEGVLREEREGSPSWGLDERERIEKALLELKSGEVNTIKEAATKWRVHYDKIQRRASGRTAVDAKQGPRAVLWQYEEELLSSWMIAMGSAGFPVTQAALKDTVQMILKRGKRPNPFPNGRPSDGWYRCFIRRNPEVNSRKTSIPFWSFNSNPSGQFQDTWCGKFSHFLSTLELQGKPGNIWVLDSLECQGLDQSENPQTELRAENTLKTTTTICICCNALGQFIPPFIIYSGKKKEKSWDPLAGAPAGTESCFTRYGDVTSDSIMDWFSRHFLRYISEQPVVLLHSGCWGQVTFDLFTIAQEHGVHFFRIPPTVPIGESFFGSFKKCWEKSWMKWLRENQGMPKVKRKHLAQILGFSWHEFKSLDHGKLSFGRYGVYPPNYDAFMKGTIPMEGRVDNINELRTGIDSGGSVITEVVTGFHGRVGTSGRVMEDGTFLEDTNVVEVVTTSTEGHLIKDESIGEESRVVHNHQSGADGRDSSYMGDDGVVRDENGLHGDDTAAQVSGIQPPNGNELSQGVSIAESNDRVPCNYNFDQGTSIVQGNTCGDSDNMVKSASRVPQDCSSVFNVDGKKGESLADCIIPEHIIAQGSQFYKTSEGGAEGGSESVGGDEIVICDGIVVDNYIILDPEGSENISDIGDTNSSHYREG